MRRKPKRLRHFMKFEKIILLVKRYLNYLTVGATVSILLTIKNAYSRLFAFYVPNYATSY